MFKNKKLLEIFKLKINVFVIYQKK